MSTDFIIQRATAKDSPEIAVMVGELLAEIMKATGIQTFGFKLVDTINRLNEFIRDEKYFVFIARIDDGSIIGFITIHESYALYAEGAFGTITEFYVRPVYRSVGVGRSLVSQAKSFGESRRWTRLEVTTPPLPQFEKTLAFYESEGFSITGGRKLKTAL